MDTSDVEAAVIALARKMHDEGVPGDGMFLVHPTLLFFRLKKERPDVISYLKQRFPEMVPERDLRDLVPFPKNWRKPQERGQSQTRVGVRIVRRRPEE